MSVVRAFGPFEKPRYAATVGWWLPGAHKNGWSTTAWCCPGGKGHRTPQAAAQHAARIMASEWKRS